MERLKTVLQAILIGAIVTIVLSHVSEHDLDPKQLDQSSIIEHQA